ncbi:unnamed protein product [Angiostrongylus costaricensis]|uniref:Transmembrane protein n=1 Tax=Angiostrongylus costaricensis TaxID=334426 RepID=A0A0R3PZV4_ANGCS|nr:unnamed protein product [Angiostrongylus costaricensis]
MQSKMTLVLYRFAPPSIMDTLFKLKTVALWQALKEWAPKGRLTNIDDVVDYVLYRGPTFSSEMSALAHLSQLSVFTRKAVICALLLPLNTLLLAGANSYEGKHIPTGEYENSVISDVLLLFGYVLAVIVYLK